jgi:pectate lyase
MAGPRIIIFEVSGNIVLKSILNIKNDNITIAGQTAPGDGICIQNYKVNIDADNVIIRFMRFRMGDLTKQQHDALGGKYHQNIIIDHCSISWSIDECASFYSNKNFTLQWCIVSESLNKSFHKEGEHGSGAIWGGTNATFHHNLLAHHNNRNPRFNGGKQTETTPNPFGIENVDFRNNVIYNWGVSSISGGVNGQYNLVANYYKPGPGTNLNKRSRILDISLGVDPVQFPPGYGSFFLSDNYIDGNIEVTQDNWNGGVERPFNVPLNKAKASKPFPFEPIREQLPIDAYNSVLNYAGANLSRDAVDTRIINEAKNGTATFNGSKTGKKGIIDSQKDVGNWPTLNTLSAPDDFDGDGMPDDWETENKLYVNIPDAKGKNLSTVYDNIEVYINSIVKHIIEAQLK